MFKVLLIFFMLGLVLAVPDKNPFSRSRTSGGRALQGGFTIRVDADDDDHLDDDDDDHTSQGAFVRTGGFSSGEATVRSGFSSTGVHLPSTGRFSSGSFVSSAPLITILRDDRDDPVDGAYKFEFETSDGLIRSEQGNPSGPEGAVSQRGSWSFTFPDGTPAHFTFVADTNGYQVQSDLIPTPHPLPPHALAQIEKAERERAAGIIHDGQYRQEDHLGASVTRDRGTSGASSFRGSSGGSFGVPLPATSVDTSRSSFGSSSSSFRGSSGGSIGVPLPATSGDTSRSSFGSSSSSFRGSTGGSVGVPLPAPSVDHSGSSFRGSSGGSFGVPLPAPSVDHFGSSFRGSSGGSFGVPLPAPSVDNSRSLFGSSSSSFRGSSFGVPLQAANGFSSSIRRFRSLKQDQSEES